jgi:hypothetical protein
MDQQQMISEIMKEMEQDIRCDIYGDIHGHEHWAEEISHLRAELRRMKEMSVEDSWNRLQEAIALAGSPKIKSIELDIRKNGK